MAGRPRAERHEIVLEDSRWTREEIRRVAQMHARDRFLAETVADSQLFRRLGGEMVRRFLPDWDPTDPHLTGIVTLYQSGLTMEAVAGYYGSPVPTISRVLRDYASAEVVGWYLSSVDGRELVAICERIGISISTGYRVIERFVHFCSAAIKREALRSWCEQTHESSGGDGNVPLADRRVWACGNCDAGVISRAFNRYGDLMISADAIDHTRLVYLKAMGVHVHKIDREVRAAG
jgi:hypothetical protein